MYFLFEILLNYHQNIVEQKIYVLTRVGGMEINAAGNESSVTQSYTNVVHTKKVRLAMTNKIVG